MTRQGADHNAQGRRLRSGVEASARDWRVPDDAVLLAAREPPLRREQAQVVDGLGHRQHLVERREGAERPVPAGPQQHLADVQGRPRPALDGGGDRLEPGVVMDQQLVDSRMAAGGDRTVRREQPGVGKCPDVAQRAEIVAEWRGDGSRLQADRGRDVREDMVAGEQQPVPVLEVDEVAPRVPRGGPGVQAALADGKQGARLEPRVRQTDCWND